MQLHTSILWRNLKAQSSSCRYAVTSSELNKQLNIATKLKVHCCFSESSFGGERERAKIVANILQRAGILCPQCVNPADRHASTCLLKCGTVCFALDRELTDRDVFVVVTKTLYASRAGGVPAAPLRKTLESLTKLIWYSSCCFCKPLPHSSFATTYGAGICDVKSTTCSSVHRCRLPIVRSIAKSVRKWKAAVAFEGTDQCNIVTRDCRVGPE